jgi:hypothetical protein
VDSPIGKNRSRYFFRPRKEVSLDEGRGIEGGLAIDTGQTSNLIKYPIIFQ